MNSTVNPNRHVPSVCNGHSDYMENGNCEIFYTTTPNFSGKFVAIAYIGKGRTPSWHYTFKTKDRMEDYIETYVTERKRIKFLESKKLQEKKVANSLVKCEVGQIFKYSWGYDQTNVDFYQVTEVKGKRATLRAIEAKTVEGSSGFMCCNVTPIKDNFREGNMAETLTKIVKAGYKGQPTFSMEFGSLSLTSETEQSYCSWYA
jgi:hypothetical protein